MNKTLLSFFFVSILLFTVIAPSYYSLVENENFIEFVDNLNEEEERHNKKISKFDLKFFSNNPVDFSFSAKKLKQKIAFITKHYSYQHLEYDTPPPELLS